MTTATKFSISELKKHLPQELMQPSTAKAVQTLVLSTVFLSLGVLALSYFPWYLLPIGWAFTAMVASGLFAVGYACSEGKFFSNGLLNEITGMICMAPLLYPFESWKKFSRNSSKNQLVDTDCWMLSSAWDWLRSNIYFESNKVLIINAIGLYLFSGLVFGLIVYFKGFWGLCKFYLIPLAIYHFVMSSFLKLNTEAKKDNQYGFVDVPKLVEFITNNANHAYSLRVTFSESDAKKNDDISKGFSLSESISSLVPTYNFSSAKEEIQKKFATEYKSLQLNLETWRKIFFDNEVKVDWTVTLFIAITTIMAICAVVVLPFNWKTYLLGFIFYYLGGIGITMGYHRLWSHRSFDAHWSIQVILMLMGSSSFEGSIISWCNDHRYHHRYTDTDRDPYNVKRGLFYAHMGWLFYYRDPKEDFIQHDLAKDPLVRFNHNHYGKIAFSTGMFLPMGIAGYFWGDWLGGLFIAGVAKTVFLLHCTWCINSLCHAYGEFTFADERTPRDSALVSYVTFGEGYHNFHHEFPYDYRNGLHFYDYDPGKWLIYIFSFVGLTWNLKKFRGELFEKGRLQMKQKKLDQEKALYNWGPDKSSLKEITMEEFEQKCKTEELMIINNLAYNVKNFSHPGGDSFINVYKSKDATKEFNGVVYDHSSAARNLLDEMAIYRIKK